MTMCRERETASLAICELALLVTCLCGACISLFTETWLIRLPVGSSCHTEASRLCTSFNRLGTTEYSTEWEMDSYCCRLQTE